MPDSFVETSGGLLLVANGFDDVLRWDGLSSQMEGAGIDPPATAPTLTFSGAGSITGDYYAYVRFLDRLGNFSNLSPISAVATASSHGTLTYTAVPTSDDPKVTTRQILRNTAGQATTFYVDVETTDLTSTSFSSTRTDSELSAQESQALFDTEGNDLANRHTVPPNHKAVLAAHLDRAFLAGEIVYDEGCVVVTLGSTTVTGIGTEWMANLANRYLHVVGGDKPYLISSVDVTNQTLTLSEAYAAPSDAYASYGIRPAPAERRLVYFSEAGLPESWPATNALTLQEDGDEIVGLMPKGSFLYILERRHIYRLTFQDDPREDGFVFLAGSRGCVNNRCWVLVDDEAYMLDERGVHKFGSGQDSEHLTIAIQGLFDGDDALFRINWRAARYFHAVHFPGQGAIRWFVALAGSYLPRHALCHDYNHGHWWVEEFPRPIGASAVGFLGASDRRVLLGSSHHKVLGYWVGTLDGADPAQGTVRGTVTSATPTSLTDTSAGFATSLANAPVVIVAGRGKGQVRLIASNTSTALTVTEPWATEPDATSKYQVGGIPWTYRTGTMRWKADEGEHPRRVEVLFQPTISEATMDLRIYHDLDAAAQKWWSEYTSADANGVESTRLSEDLVVDLTKATGIIQKRMSDSRELYIDGNRFVSVELRGVTNAERQSVFTLQIDGAEGGQS